MELCEYRVSFTLPEPLLLLCMLKCCFKGGLFYIISLLLFEAQRMLMNVSAAQKLILGNVLVGKQEDKKRRKLSDSVTSNKVQIQESVK